MKKFIYHNYNTEEDIEIEAKDIILADKEYEKQTNLKPSKCSFITCRIVKPDKVGHLSGKDYDSMITMFDKFGYNE